jgi:hypothetical protein
MTLRRNPPGIAAFRRDDPGGLPVAVKKELSNLAGKPLGLFAS